MTDLQAQLVNSRAESVQALREREEMVQRIQQTDGTLVGLRAQNDVLIGERRESMAVIGRIPEALAALKGGKGERPRMLMESRGLGKPQILTNMDTDDRFRMWVNKAEDYIVGQLENSQGEKFREALWWAAEHDGEIDELEMRCSYGDLGNAADHIEDLAEKIVKYTACSVTGLKECPSEKPMRSREATGWRHGGCSMNVTTVLTEIERERYP